MKIRICGNSIRYRLTRPEVEQFKASGVITAQTDFGNKMLTYTFIDDAINLVLPLHMADEWTNTERVGFEDTDGTLALSVEKDFKCLDNVTEDQSDNYPNPLANPDHA
jgi:hypothetical protein